MNSANYVKFKEISLLSVLIYVIDINTRVGAVGDIIGKRKNTVFKQL